MKPALRNDRGGYTLTEVLLAVGLVAITVTGLLASLEQGLSATRKAENKTLLGTMLRDVRDRIEGQPLIEGVPRISPLFYNEDGRFIPEGADDGPRSEKFYRVDLEIVRPWNQNQPKDAPGLRAALVDVVWPVAQNGQPRSRSRPQRLHQTYLVNTLTGPDWEQIDPGYQPKIEF